MNQEQIILNEMLAGKRVTQLEVTFKFQITRLGAKVFNLRAKGYEVQGEWQSTQEGKKYKEYFLEAAEIERIKKELKKEKES